MCLAQHCAQVRHDTQAAHLGAMIETMTAAGRGAGAMASATVALQTTGRVGALATVTAAVAAALQTHMALTEAGRAMPATGELYNCLCVACLNSLYLACKHIYT